jgi:hypothetical protein
VKPQLTKELLPSGDKIRVLKEDSHSSSPHQFCEVSVDGNVELSTEGVWQPAGTTAKEAAEKSLSFNLRSADGGRFALWNDEAFTVFDCKNAKYKAGRFSINAQVIHADGDMSEKIQSFLEAFSKSYRKTLPCES